MIAVTPNHSVAPSRKQWYDRLADVIIGDEDLAPASPSSRYALICEKCFAHNGLVKESMWEDARECDFGFRRYELTKNCRVCLPQVWPLKSVSPV
jgi:hypothetical protein